MCAECQFRIWEPVCRPRGACVDSYPDCLFHVHPSPHVCCCCCCFQVGESLDTFPRRQRPPFCRTACERRMPRESESGLAALRLTSSSRGMTALWCSLWLSFLLPLCVAPARLPTAQPTGRTHDQTSYTLLIPLLEQHGR